MPTYKKDLLDDLKNRPGYAAKYLTAAAGDSTEAFLVALRDVGSARKGMTRLAADAEVNRVNLYHMLSKKGNPGIRNIRAIFDALELEIHVIDKSEPARTPIAPIQRTEPLADLGQHSLADYAKEYSFGANASIAFNYFTPHKIQHIGSPLGIERGAAASEFGTARYLLSWANRSPLSPAINV